jgi:hypothetical protein
LVLRGDIAFHRFIDWAIERGWHWQKRPDSHWLARFRRVLHQRKIHRNAADDTALASWCAQQGERIAQWIESNWQAWNEYEQVAHFARPVH